MEFPCTILTPWFQLAELQDCVSRMTKESGTRGSKAVDECCNSSEQEINSSQETPSCLFDGLNEKDQQASELLRMLNKELTEFIDLISKKDFQAMECRRKLLSCFFERIVRSDRQQFVAFCLIVLLYFRYRTLIEPKRNDTWTLFAVVCATWTAI